MIDEYFDLDNLEDCDWYWERMEWLEPEPDNSPRQCEICGDDLYSFEYEWEMCSNCETDIQQDDF